MTRQYGDYLEDMADSMRDAQEFVRDAIKKES
jgi:hypothetical protein